MMRPTRPSTAASARSQASSTFRSHRGTDPSVRVDTHTLAAALKDDGFDAVRAAISRTNRKIEYLRSGRTTGASVRLVSDTVRTENGPETDALIHEAPTLIRAHRRALPAGPTRAVIFLPGDAGAQPEHVALARLPPGSPVAHTLARAAEHAQGQEKARLRISRAKQAEAAYAALEKSAAQLRESADALAVAVANRSTLKLSRVLGKHGTEAPIAHYEFDGRVHVPEVRLPPAVAEATARQRPMSSFTLTMLETSSSRFGPVQLEQKADALPPAPPAKPTAMDLSDAAAQVHRPVESSSPLGRTPLPSPTKAPTPTATQAIESQLPRDTEPAKEGDALGIDEALARRRKTKHLIPPSKRAPQPVLDVVTDIDPMFSERVRGALLTLAVTEGRMPPVAANATVLAAEVKALKTRLSGRNASLHGALGPALHQMRVSAGMPDDWLFSRHQEVVEAAAAKHVAKSPRAAPAAPAQAEANARGPVFRSSPSGRSSASPTARRGAPGPSPAAPAATNARVTSPPAAGVFLTAVPEAAAARVLQPSQGRNDSKRSPHRPAQSQHETAAGSENKRRPASAPAGGGKGRPVTVSNLRNVFAKIARRKAIENVTLDDLVLGKKKDDDDANDPKTSVREKAKTLAAQQVELDNIQWIFADPRSYHTTVVPVVLPDGKVRIGDLTLEGAKASTLSHLYAVNPAFAVTFAALSYNTHTMVNRVHARRAAFAAALRAKRMKMATSLQQRVYTMTLAHAPKAAAVDDVMTLRVRERMEERTSRPQSALAVNSRSRGALSPAVLSRAPSASSHGSLSRMSSEEANQASQDARLENRLLQAATTHRRGLRPHSAPSNMAVTLGSLDESMHAARLSARKARLLGLQRSHTIIRNVLREVPRGKPGALSGVERSFLLLLDAILRSGLLVDSTTVFALLQQLHEDVQALPEVELDIDVERQYEIDRARKAALEIPRFKTPTRILRAMRRVPAAPADTSGRPYPLPPGLQPRASTSTHASSLPHGHGARPSSASIRWRPSSAAAPLQAVGVSVDRGVGSPRCPPGRAMAEAAGAPTNVTQRPQRPMSAFVPTGDAKPTHRAVTARQRPLSAGGLLRMNGSSIPATSRAVAAAAAGSHHVVAGGVGDDCSPRPRSPPVRAGASRSRHATPAALSDSPNRSMLPSPSRPDDDSASKRPAAVPEALMTAQERAVLVARKEWPLAVYYPVRVLLESIGVDWEIYEAWLRERNLPIPTQSQAAATAERHSGRLAAIEEIAANATGRPSPRSPTRTPQASGARPPSMRFKFETRGEALWTEVRKMIRHEPKEQE